MTTRSAAARAALLGLLLALVGGVVAPGVVAAAPTPRDLARQAEEEGDEPDDGAPDPFDRLASCVGASGRLLVVLLVDESASLRETDPDDQRIDAARAAVRSIDLIRSSGAGADVSIDMLVSTFSFDFRPVGDWTPLTADSRSRLDRRVAGLADRDASMDTDFHNALDGARRSLADRATETAQDGASTACKSILLFTDGNFTLGARETAEQREQFGTTKDYAPGIELTDDEAVEQVTRRGIDALCEAGGVADQVRADNITVVSVPLGEGSGLLEAITTGEAESGTVCGDPATTTPGAYLPASDTQELLRTFDFVASRIGGGVLAAEPARPEVCPDDPCDAGAAAFTVSKSFSRVHVLAAAPGADTRIVLAPPEGDALEVVPGDDDGTSDVGGASVAVATVADTAVTFDLTVPPDGSADGAWTVTFVGGEGTGTVQVMTFTDVIAILGESSLVVGQDGIITATVGTREGEEVDEDLEVTSIRATLTDPITGGTQTVDLVGGDDEGFIAPVPVADDVTAAVYRVTMTLEATAGGAAIRSISPEAVLPIGRPDGYPSLAPPILDFSSVEGDGTAEAVLLLRPPAEGEGCAWFDEVSVKTAPEGVTDVTAAVDGLGASQRECTPIDGPVSVVIDVDPGVRASGTVTGHVRVQLATGDGEAAIPTDVPMTFEMARGVDEAKRIILAVVLLVGGLVLPLVLLVVVNLLTTRFQNLDDVRAAWIPVIVHGKSIQRAEGRTSVVVRTADFEPLDVEDSNRRRFPWNGLIFRARTPLNPFGEPYASVAPEGGTADVAREGRRTELALGLAGSWMFLLDQDSTRAASGKDIYGFIVAFASADAVRPQAQRLGKEILDQAPGTAFRLAELAGIDHV